MKVLMALNFPLISQPIADNDKLSLLIIIFVSLFKLLFEEGDESIQLPNKSSVLVKVTLVIDLHFIYNLLFFILNLNLN